LKASPDHFWSPFSVNLSISSPNASHPGRRSRANRDERTIAVLCQRCASMGKAAAHGSESQALFAQPREKVRRLAQRVVHDHAEINAGISGLHERAYLIKALDQIGQRALGENGVDVAHRSVFFCLSD